MTYRRSNSLPAPLAVPSPGYCVVLLWVVLILSLLSGMPAFGQPGFPQVPIVPPGRPAPATPAEEESGFDFAVFQPPERELMRHLSAGRKFLSEERFSEAVAHLGKIIEHPRDYFCESEDENTSFEGLKKATLDLIGRMPEGGRQAYELQYGMTANRLLENALAQGDFAEVLAISRRYFHTQAGYRATYLVGLALLDRGEPLAAALKLSELQTWPQAWQNLEPGLSLAEASCWLQCNDRMKAQATLEELARRQPEFLDSWGPSRESNPRSLGELLAVLEAELPVAGAFRAATLDNWMMPGGTPSRNGEAEGGVPLLRRIWTVPHADKPLVDACLKWADEECRRSKLAVLPCVEPIVVGDRVFMRNIETLTALDFNSGKRLWRAPLNGRDEADSSLNIQQRAQNAATESLRMWLDRTYGTLSSDGERVFAVEDLSLPADPNQQVLQRLRVVPGVIVPGPFGRAGQDGAPPDSNRLVAYDVDSGKIVWHVGGSGELYRLPLDGTFFLGPPVPCDNRIYVQGEREGEIVVYALEAETGELLWHQPLAAVGAEGGYDLLRRMAGLSPAVADGILVCSTNAGALVAVDISTHSLRWGYLYNQANDPRRFAHLNAQNIMHLRMHNQLTWANPNPVLVDGKVLVTPPDSREIHCVRLLDGKPVWKSPSETDFFIATVREGNVVVVGSNGIRALRLADGAPGWGGRVLPLPAGGVPSGHGFASGKRYVLPLASGAVFSFDAVTGENPETVVSPTGDYPGNLVCHKGRVLSQTPTGLTLFYQREFLEGYLADALRKQPDHPTLLTLRGEMAVAGRDFETAADSFRRALRALPNEQNRARLWRVLYDRLAEDSTAPAELWKEADAMSTDPARKVAMMRLRARRARDAGDLAKAIPLYLDLLSAGEDGGAMIRVDSGRSLRVDRMVKHDLAEFRKGNPEGYAKGIAPLIDEYFGANLRSDDRRMLDSLLCCFGQIANTRAIEDHLLKAYREDGDLIRAEGILLKRASSDDPATAAAATAELALLLHGVERFDDAAVCYRDLAVKWTDVVCRDGKKGIEFVKAVPAGDPVWKSIRSDLAWPAGEIRVSKSVDATAAAMPQSVPLRVVGSPLPFAQHKSYRFDHRTLEFEERDGFGRLLWKLPLGEADPRGRAYGRLSSELTIVGHRAYLVVNNVLTAVDTFNPKAPKVLWRRPLFGRLSTAAAASGTSPETDLMGLLGRSGLAPLQNVFGIGNYGTADFFVAGAGQVCFRQDSTYAAADPFSGDLLWTNAARTGAGPFFGNDRFLFALDQMDRPPSGNVQRDAALTLAAEDGRFLKESTVPVRQDVVVYMGDRALTKHIDGRHLVVGLYDIINERNMTAPRLYDMRSRIVNQGRSVAGILEPDGKFHLMSLEDGKILATENLEGDGATRSFMLFEDKFGYYVITQSAARISRTVMPSTIPGCRSQLIHAGHVHAFNREGRRRWASPVKISNECFLTDQPANLPVLVFASNRTAGRQDRRTAFSSTLRCIDKRTGLSVCEEEFPNRAQQIEVVADPVTGTVQVEMMPHSITLTYTGSGEMKAVQETRIAEKSSTLAAMRRSLNFGVETTYFDALSLYEEVMSEMIPVVLPMQDLDL